MNSSTKTLRIHRFNNGWIFLSGFLLLQLATTNNSFFVSAALRGSAIADDWDTMCVAQANALGHCVGASGGDLELCKNCIKMAAHMNRWEIALAGCFHSSEFCNGCQNNIEAYFDCGKNSLVESTIETAIASRPPEESFSLDQIQTGQQQPEVAIETNTETESVSQQRPGNPVGNVGGTTNLEANSNSFTLPSGSGGAQGETPPFDRIAGNSESAAAVVVGGIAEDWDRACPVHAHNLAECVDNHNGVLELCKSCVKMASSLDSAEFALRACGNEPYICLGCETTMKSYYECGKLVL